MRKSLMNIEQIADDIILQLSAEDKKFIAESSADDLISLHHGLGTQIRNDYALWYENPLTENWRLNEDSRDIRNGVDYSEDHPDYVSMYVVKFIRLKLKADKV